MAKGGLGQFDGGGLGQNWVGLGQNWGALGQNWGELGHSPNPSLTHLQKI